MEKQDRKFLEAIKKGLEQDSLRVNQLLKQASASKLEQLVDAVRWEENIIKAIHNKGGTIQCVW